MSCTSCHLAVVYQQGYGQQQRRGGMGMGGAVAAGAIGAVGGLLVTDAIMDMMDGAGGDGLF